MDYKEYRKGKYTIRRYFSGNKRWYFNGKRHRENGPAVEYADGSNCWYINGELHRVNGPAVEWPDGTKVWWINDREYTKEVYYSIMWNKLPREAKLDYIYGL